MAYLSDIEIAQGCKMQPIGEIAKTAGIDADSAVLLQVALQGSKGFTPMELKSYNVTGLGEFVREINGETDLLINTEDVIRSSREVLTIQAAAD